MKDFLSEYGFAILAAIVVILLIAMCTPVGNLIKNQIMSVVDKFATKTESKLYTMEAGNETGIILKQLDENGKFSITATTDSETDVLKASYRVKDQNSNWNDWVEIGQLGVGSKEHSGEFKAKIENGNKIQIRVTDEGKNNGVYSESNIVEYTGESSEEESLTPINGDNLTPTITMPVLGDIIVLDSKEYRVLKTDGYNAFLMTMYSPASVVTSPNPTLLEMGGYTGVLYKNSDLDKYMNETFYKSLSFKDAIVPQNIKQSMYLWNGSPYTVTSDWTYGYSETQGWGTTYHPSKIGEVEVGERYVYALDSDEVLEYMIAKVGTTFTKQDLHEFFGKTRSSGGIGNTALRTAGTIINSGHYCFINFIDYQGMLFDNYNHNSVAMRPAFVIDLTKVDFTINE